ncbi:hypothetical protein ACFWVK_33320, partial [Streptomyces sp. NPDC058667]
MTREVAAGAAFGAGAAFLGAGVAGGAWPTGWAALVCALVLTALGVTVRAVRLGGTDLSVSPGATDPSVSPGAGEPLPPP